MRARPLLLLLLVALLGFVGRLVWGPGSASESIVGLGQGSPSVPPGHAEAQDAAVREGPETSHLQRRQDLSQREEAHSRYGVSGQVKWEDGSGVADQAVILVEGDTGTTLAETRTDALGGYTIFLPQGDHVSTPPRNSYDLYCPGRALAHADSAHATPDDPPARVDMVLLAGRDLQVLSRHHLDGTPAGDVQVHAVCEIDHEHELFTFTDSDGKGILHIPHEGPWSLTAHTRQLEGYAIGFPITPWLTADRKEVVIEVISQPTEVHLQAVDAVTGAAVEDARFRVARVPEDARFLPPGGLAQLPSPLSQQLGSLHTVFEIPGRAFLKVEAEGFLPEVLEWVEDDRRQHQIPLIPLMPHPIEVTRHGRPVSTEVTIGFNRRSKVLHENELVHDLAAEPQVGTLHRFQTDAQGICDLMLPDQSVDDAPTFFDLWINSGDTRRFMGSLSADRLGNPPWVFELAPPSGTLILDVVDADGNGVPAVPYQIGATIDDPVAHAEGRSRSQSTIRTTNMDGRIEAQLWAPSQVQVTGSGTLGLGSSEVDAEGHLEEGGTLHLKLVIDPQDRSMMPYSSTRGRIVVEDGEDYARDQRLLSVRATPLDQRALQAPLKSWQVQTEADRNGYFRFQLPEGLYAFTLDSDDFATARDAGRIATGEAGADDLEIPIPPPSGLRIHTTDLNSGHPLRPDSVVLQVGGRLLTELETWEGGDAASLSLFADRVTYVVECEGYAPQLGQADLEPGRTTEVYLGLDHGRRITLQPMTAKGTLQSPPGLRIEWLDPPGGGAPYEVFLLDYAWPDAPLTAIRIAAFLDETRIGTFDLAAGMEPQVLRIPLPSDDAEDQ